MRIYTRTFAVLSLVGPLLPTGVGEEMPEELRRWLVPQRWDRDHHGPVLALGDAPSFDDTHVFAPCVARWNDWFHVWYCGATGSVTQRVFQFGLDSSPDGLAFSRRRANPLLGYGERSILTPALLRAPDGAPLREDGSLRMWFASAGKPIAASSHALYHTTSRDGITWSEPTGPLLVNAYCPRVMRDGDVYQMWFTDVTDDRWVIRHARSRDGMQWVVDRTPVIAAAVQAAPDKQEPRPAEAALVFLIAGQSNAGGVAAFSPESNRKAGLAEKHPTLPGSTAREVGIPTTVDAYPRSSIWGPSGFARLSPGKNLKGGYRDPWRHGIELPMAMLLEEQYPEHDKYFVKHGPGGHNLHTQWAAVQGPDYREFLQQYRRAMADLKNRYHQVQVLGLYWDQGESDRKEAQAYGNNLRALFAAFRRDTGRAELQIFVRKHLFQHGDDSFTPILDAQVEVTREDPHAHLLDLDLGSNEKNFKAWAWTDQNGHLSSKAYLELSRRILAVRGARETRP